MATSCVVVLCWVSLVVAVQCECQSVEMDVAVAGSAAAGPALEERLQEQHGLRECQAGRGRKGFMRSRVRNPWGDADCGWARRLGESIRVAGQATR